MNASGRIACAELANAAIAQDKAYFERDEAVRNESMDALRTLLRKAVGAVEFYADKSSWVTRTGRMGTSPIDTMDREVGCDGEYAFAGGKRARAFLHELKEAVPGMSHPAPPRPCRTYFLVVVLAIQRSGPILPE